MKHAAPDAATLRNRLVKLIASTQLQVSDQQIDQLIQLVLLLHKWNQAYNLTSVRKPEEMLVRHIMDSILIAPYVQGERVIDVGTGPGLPGLPLAIMHPDKHFVLIDSLGKRINFIRQVVHQLGLSNVEAVQSRVENYEPDQQFSCILSRAFASLADMLAWCHHLPSQSGQFVALKGQLDTDELAQVPAGFEVITTHRIEVPQLHAERHVVLVSPRNT